MDYWGAFSFDVLLGLQYVEKLTCLSWKYILCQRLNFLNGKSSYKSKIFTNIVLNIRSLYCRISNVLFRKTYLVLDVNKIERIRNTWKEKSKQNPCEWWPRAKSEERLYISIVK